MLFSNISIWELTCYKLKGRQVITIFELFFCKQKYLLVGASSMLWTGQRISEWVSESVRDVCMSHQSDRIYYKQPIKFLVLKANGIWEDLIPIQFRNGQIYSSIKEEEVFIYWVNFGIFCGLDLRILVMDEMSLEVWNSAWGSCMQMNEMFLFLVTKVTWYFCFSQGVNSIRRHASLLLVLRKCFRRDRTILI